jgi:hypothetical protein
VSTANPQKNNLIKNFIFVANVGFMPMKIFLKIVIEKLVGGWLVIVLMTSN